MAVRRGGKVAALVKIKLRKHHGPKRRMFHCWDRSARLSFGQAGLLTKYNNFESFAQSCATRAKIKTFLKEMWAEYCILPTNVAKDAYLKDVEVHHKAVVEAALIRSKKAKKSLTKGK